MSEQQLTDPFFVSPRITVADQLAQRLHSGDTVSDFSLIDIYGVRFNLFEALATSRVLLKFYRGGWCPYCSLELMAYQNLLHSFRELGVRVIALSPEGLMDGTQTAVRNLLSFPIATDEDLGVARQFGIVVELSENERQFVRDWSHPSLRRSRASGWELPLPATYVIDQERRIQFESVSLDYRRRVDPSEVLRKLQSQS